MTKFLALYIGNEASFEKSGWAALEESERKKREAAGMQAWIDWRAKHAGSIVNEGGPVGKTKCAAASGVADARNSVCGYVVVEAASHEAAAQMFDKHPHFTIFPGVSVEIMECLPMPGM